MSGLFGGGTKISNSAAKVGSLRVQTSSQGVPIPIVFGLARLSPNLIGFWDFTAIPHTETQTSGKGGGVEQSNTTYTYTCAVALGISEGPLATGALGPSGTFLKRIWKGKEIIPQATVEDFGFDEFRGVRFDDGQEPWPYLVTNHPADAFGLPWQGYVAHGALDLGASDSLPNFSFEVYGISDIVTVGIDDVYTVSDDTPDINPAFVVKQLLQNEIYGAGFRSGVRGSYDTFVFEPPLGDLTAFANYAAAANFLIAPVFQKAQPAAEILTRLCGIANVGMVWSEGLLKFVPYGDSNVSHTPYLPGNTQVLGPTVSYVPDLTPKFALSADEGDFLAEAGEDPVKVRRRRRSDAYNSVRIQCLNRENDYNEHIVEAKDAAAIHVFGYRPKDIEEIPEICSIDVAQRVAQTKLQREVNLLNEFSFRLGWKHSALEPMDIVTLTEPSLGLSAKLVRIISTSDAGEEETGIECVAEEVFAGLGTAQSYGVQAVSGFIKNLNAPPGNINAPVIFQPPISLTGSPEVWIGGSGGVDWGGAEVWFSDTGASFAKIGVLTLPARHGVLSANAPIDVDPGSSTISVDLTVSRGALVSASNMQADAGDTASYIGAAGSSGEIVSYGAVSLTSAYNYNLTGYKRRGQYCSFATAHLTGERFMRLDEAVKHFAVDPSRVGTTVHFKFLSFNLAGVALQDLAAVVDYPYTVQPLGLSIVAGLAPTSVEATEALCVDVNANVPGGRLTLRGRVNLHARLSIFSL